MIVLVVLNYNDADTTSKFVSSIRNYQKIEHIVIVDNCSTDDSVKKLNTLTDQKITLVQTDANNGYASGNNYGVKYAKKCWNPEYIIISNPDIEFKESIIDKMLSVMKRQINAAAVTCRMNCTSGIRLPIAWRLPSYRDCVMENLIVLKRMLNYTNEYTDEKLKEEVLEVEAIPGSFFMLNTDKFEKVGGFDENTFLYYEENILGARFKKNGLKQYLITNEEYIHNHSVSINKSIQSVSERLELAYLSRAYYCEKYLKESRMQKILLRMSFEIGRSTYLFATSILKGHK